MKKILALLLCAVLLAGCSNTVAEVTVPPTTPSEPAALPQASIEASAAPEYISRFDTVLALDLLDAAKKYREDETQQSAASTSDLDPARKAEIEAMIEARSAAKKDKNYAEADRIRAALAEMGVTLKDTPAGTTYTVAG